MVAPQPVAINSELNTGGTPPCTTGGVASAKVLAAVNERKIRQAPTLSPGHFYQTGDVIDLLSDDGDDATEQSGFAETRAHDFGLNSLPVQDTSTNAKTGDTETVAGTKVFGSEVFGSSALKMMGR